MRCSFAALLLALAAGASGQETALVETHGPGLRRTAIVARRVAATALSTTPPSSPRVFSGRSP